MPKQNFTTMGTFGDTIYSLCLIKHLGGGDMYVKLDALDTFARTNFGWQDAGPAKGRLTRRDYDLIEPLLNAQDYLDTVAVWTDEKDDFPQLSEHWKQHLIKGWQGNQTECYALTLGLDIHDPAIKNMCLYKPWLTPVDPIRIPGKPFVVNRTVRYLYGAPSDEWYRWVDNGLGEYAVFVGSEEEHKDFEDVFKCTIEHYKTKDLLELAQVIQGCEQFMGNQSVALSIAIGLGKSYWCEVRKDYEQTQTPHGGYGDTWFPRINGNYF
jgi:hypothetical protein